MEHEAADLAILGSYPPPYGGVGVHVRRLCPLLDARGIRYVVYNATSDVGDGRRIVGVYGRRRTWLLRYLFTGTEPVIYMMSARLAAWLVGALMASWRGKHLLVRLRDTSLPDWIERSWWRRMLAGFALRRMSGVVGVSRRLVEAAASLGIAADKLHWAPGFLPPGEETIDRDAVAPAVWAFADVHRPLICACGKVCWYEGQDLYGLDHLVELAGRLKPDYPDLGIVVCFWDHKAEEQRYLDELMQRAAAIGAADNVLFNTQSGTFVPVIAASDVFVRPTNTDGDANSIREALSLGIPAVASDAVERPAGTRLFRTRDLNDFEMSVRAALETSGRRDRTGAGAGVHAGWEDRARVDAYLDFLARFTPKHPGVPTAASSCASHDLSEHQVL